MIDFDYFIKRLDRLRADKKTQEVHLQSLFRHYKNGDTTHPSIKNIKRFNLKRTKK